MEEPVNYKEYRTGSGVPVIAVKDQKCDMCGCGPKVWLHGLSDGRVRKSSEQPTSEQLPQDKVWHGAQVYKFGTLGTMCVFCKFPETMPKFDNQLKLW